VGAGRALHQQDEPVPRVVGLNVCSP
jgi:hypothetical protein